MVTLFHEMMYKEIKVYVDDMIAKSKTEKEHVQVLRKLFLRLRKFQLKLNPAKCTFGARSGKLFGFVVSKRGIEIDLDKVKAIQELPPPHTQKEVRVYVNQKAVKGSAIADFLASRALEDYEPLSFDFPNEDLMYVATTEEDSQEGHLWKLNFDGASNAVVNKQEDMKPIQMSIYEAPAHCCNIEEEEEKDDHPWYQDILRYVKSREYPDKVTENDKRTLRRLASDYVLDGEILYKRRKDQVHETSSTGHVLQRMV
ncbi:uncharacterized protein [Gossypium hirsutum]|uniref:Reverse transcriptase domain-containing protein n=1 Tax=Gossypium hirsutum TaxID=3635 RepID=A0ABM2ZD24_GOSHI|nr:uncharacterized protein LOC121211391 [Gossypium hirsutum]